MLHVKFYCIFILFSVSQITADDKCVQTKSLTILKGCEVLNGLEIISESGFVVNDDKCDELLPKGDFAEKPVIRYNNAYEGKLYTIVMLDPDAPKHKAGEFFLHMIVTNVPGASLKTGDTSQGNVVTAYRKPSPPKGSGEHRYTFLLYEQAGKEEFNPESPEERFKFNYDAWLSGTNLCSPIAGQQFKAKH